jgi:prevent-host-death family protein
MKTASVRELRNHYTQLFSWIGAGEEIVITQRGRPVARLCPEPMAASSPRASWGESATMRRDRSQEITLSAEESAKIRGEAGGQW